MKLKNLLYLSFEVKWLCQVEVSGWVLEYTDNIKYLEYTYWQGEVWLTGSAFIALIHLYETHF